MGTVNDFAKHLKLHKSTTKLQAAKSIYEINVGDKVMKLRAKGWVIRTNMIERPNMQAYARYELVSYPS